MGRRFCDRRHAHSKVTQTLYGDTDAAQRLLAWHATLATGVHGAPSHPAGHGLLLCVRLSDLRKPFGRLFLVLIGAFQFTAIGLVVASRAQTVETASGLMNLVMLPMYTLCGAFFSYERFPEIFHPIIKLLPLTPVIDSLRSVMMDGESIWSQWPEMLVMIGWTVIPFAIAMAIFRWRD